MENLGNPACVQYNDFTGTVAADKSDPGYQSLREYMVEQGHVIDGEHIVAIEFYVGDGRFLGGKRRPSNVSVSVVVSKDGIGKGELRGIRIDMDITDFFMFFKRFVISLVHGNFEKIRGDDLPVEYDDS
ncbi:MAG: hypothetical protein F4069_08995 [Rhodothermaceae bacterium]|nr:hypothetical protein [Rhodothermaceae bacterium]MYG68557.1 hypothetical protein [Rhodothermaceae bacterium]MYJ45443.1 hypothetical protein [Rhodothermaceae bacterium]